jgi:hypothetical protein
MKRRAFKVWAAVAVVIGAGCGVGGEPDLAPGSDPGETRGVSSAIKVCPDWGCGENSPQIDALGFHELNLLGTAGSPRLTDANGAGLAIRAVDHQAQLIAANGAMYDLAVVDGHIVGSSCSKATECTYLQGQDLVGAQILLQRGKAAYAITIDSVRTTEFFVDRSPTEAYRLLWSAAGAKPTNLCNNIPLVVENLADQGGGNDGEYGSQELMGLDPNEAVVFEGDRIDAVARTMSTEANDRWFNIGCAAAALAKLRLTRNTIHAQAPGLLRAWQQRQATLKMFSADYCGTGAPFTVGGQRLVWKGDLMTDFFTKPRELEARWSERGALCLSMPRMLYPTSAYGAQVYPDIGKMISGTCKVPRCSDLSFDFDGADRVSANPILPVP